MVDLKVLKYLSGQKRKDAEVLFRKNRNNGAVYLMGYALEFSFKRKVGQTLGFNSGFPESKADFNLYSSQIAIFNSISTGITLTQIKQIKNHDLSQLLMFSGAEARIIGACFTEWQVVKEWNPENRYRIKRFTRGKTSSFMLAAKRILNEIV